MTDAPQQTSETVSPGSTLGSLRAEVRHDTVLIGGIFAYFATMQEACEWVATFPKAIWAQISTAESRVRGVEEAMPEAHPRQDDIISTR